MSYLLVNIQLFEKYDIILRSSNFFIKSPVIYIGTENLQRHFKYTPLQY